MKQVINRKLYDTETATELATNAYWDGNNWDRHGRSETLFRTSNSRFFSYHRTRWQGERNWIETLSTEEAKDRYEFLSEHSVEWEEAFGEKVEMA